MQVTVDVRNYLYQEVKVKIDRPLGSKHPKFDWIYERNYGYIEGTVAGDGEPLDAYILMENTPLKEYEGRCIGIVKRLDEDDPKLIVVPEAYDLDDETIEEEIAFQEKWHNHELIRE